MIVILCLQEITFLFSLQNNKMQNISQVTFRNIYELAKSQIAWNEIKTSKKCFKTNTCEHYVNTL